MTNPTRQTREERAAMLRTQRRDAIMAAAMGLAAQIGHREITRNGVAQLAGVANGSVNHEFGTVDDLRDAVLAEAIDRENLPIIARAVATGDPAASGIDPDLKKRALDSLAA